MSKQQQCQTQFTRNTRRYLETFNCILAEMICGMTYAHLSRSISHNFIVQMIPHHKAAIQMSENILKYTSNPEIEQIACNIISEQTKSILDMEKILCCCNRQCNSEKDLCAYKEQTEKVFQTMFDCMRTAPAVNSNDCNFLREMMPHHEGAVAFSETTLKYCICEELKPILQAIITSQKQGICRMKELADCLCC